MSFDINQWLIDDNGYFLEEEAQKYQDTLVKRFANSEEGRAFLKGQEVDWADLFLDVVIRRLGMMLQYVYTDVMREIFYDVIPATVVVDPKEASTVIEELKAFFQFLKREFSLPNADACLKVLNQKNLLKRFTDALNDPSNYSPTKIILMQMVDEGVDITDQGQVATFIEGYNASIAEAMKPPPVTEKAQAQHKAVKTLMKAVCSEHLNSEYYDMSLKLLDMFLFQYPDRLERGQAKSWASAIVYTIGRVNFLFDPSQTPHLTAGELCQKFNISQGTASSKSTELMDYFDMMQFDPEWTLPSKLEHNPFVWMMMMDDGIIADIRNAPRDIQVKAFERGMIPYVPADKK